MIKSVFGDKRKLTPNEFAKEILADALIAEMEFYFEKREHQLQNATEREKDEVQKQLKKRAKGLLKYLGLFETYDGGMFFPESDDK